MALIIITRNNKTEIINHKVHKNVTKKKHIKDRKMYDMYEYKI